MLNKYLHFSYQSISMNTKYAPYLPADEDGSTPTTIENYGRLLDKKFSIQPLLHALEASDKAATAEPSTSGIGRKINVSNPTRCICALNVSNHPN